MISDKETQNKNQKTYQQQVLHPTEDCAGMGNQAFASVNASGSSLNSNRKLVQQAFHPSLFLTRPRSSSLGSIPANINKEVIDLTQQQHVNDDSQPTQTEEQTINKTQPAYDISWQRVPETRNPKRKKISESSNEEIHISNRYSSLPVDTPEGAIQAEPTAKKPSKPPPIVLYGIEDINKLTELLLTASDKNEFSFKTVNKNQLRIISANADAYKKIITLIRESGLIGHTFNKKDERCFRVAIKNLHHSTPISAIKEELEKTGNVVQGAIINAKYGPEKLPTSTFFANFIPGPKNKLIKDIKYICNQSVVIEDPKKKKEIAQCQRCQQYGHTKNYCMRPYRCVKCAQSHKTSDCPKKDRSTPAKCALCQGAHPANYKGCQVYIEISTRRFKQHQTKKPTHNYGSNNNTNTYQPTRVQDKTYADATKTNTHHTNINRTEAHNTMSNLEKLLTQQSEKFELILEQMSTLMRLITMLVEKLTK